jgi:acyl-CoA dehydrogenase
MSDEPDLALAAVRRFVRQELRPNAAAWDQTHTFPIEAFRKFHELGWLQAFVPEGLGGAGFSSLALCDLMREVGAGSSGFATSLIAVMLAGVPVVEFGSEELKRRSVRHFCEHFALWSFCFTEPDAGSDVFRIRTRARRVDGGYRLVGQKCFATNASFSEHFVVIALIEAEEQPRAASIALYLPRSSAGLGFGEPWAKLGHRSSNTTEVFFDDVFVPEEHRIGREGDGFRVAFHSLQRSRLFFAAAATGVCDYAGELVLTDLKDRIRYGKPLLTQPVIQDRLADMYTRKEASWQLTRHAARLWDAGRESLTESSMAKLFSGNMVVEFVGNCMELLGGSAYADDGEIARLYRDAKLFEIIEGPSFVQKAIIAKELFRPLISKG